MTVNNIVSLIDTIRPNNVTNDMKISWIEILEKKIAEHMTRYAETKTEVSSLDENSRTLLGEEYMYMYAYYGVAMIDLANQDIAMYNNSSSYFNDMFENWQKKWRREHLPHKNEEDDA